MRIAIASLIIAALLILPAAGWVDRQSTAPASAATGAYIGVSPDLQAGDLTSQVSKFEGDAGKKVAIINFYYDGESALSSQAVALLDSIRNHGSIPMMSWNAGPGDSDVSNSQCSSYTLASYARGDHDAYLQAWAQGLKAWGRQILVRWAWEMNGNWYCWGAGVNGNTPQDYINAWRHVHDLFQQAGVSNVLWVWSPNFDNGGTYPIAPYFPGTAYVDWVALDGYNWAPIYGPSRSFDSLFGTSLATLASLTSKPIMIAETASNETGDGGATKAAWITDTFTHAIPARSQIQAVLWLNATEYLSYATANWPIESSGAAQQAFASAVSSSYYLSNWAQTQSSVATPDPTATPTTPAPAPPGASALVNGSFDTPGSTWYAPWWFTPGKGSASASLVKDSGYDGASSARIDVTSTDVNNPWNVQFYQPNLPITGSQPVTISFAAKASKNRAIGVAVGSTGFYVPSVNLTTSWQTFSYTFTPGGTSSGALTFNLAQDSGSVWLDAVTFSSGAAPSQPVATPTATPSGGSSLLQDGSFDTTGAAVWYAPWWFEAGAGTSNAQMAKDSGYDGASSARVDVYSMDAAHSWYVQLYQPNLALQAGKPVTVSFVAKASKGRAIGVAMGGTNFYAASVSLSTGWQTYTYTFTPASAVSSALTFNLAQDTGSVWLDAVTVQQ